MARRRNLETRSFRVGLPVAFSINDRFKNSRHDRHALRRVSVEVVGAGRDDTNGGATGSAFETETLDAAVEVRVVGDV